MLHGRLSMMLGAGPNPDAVADDTINLRDDHPTSRGQARPARYAIFLSLAMNELGHQAQLAGHEVPYFSEWFGIFNNDDAYFLRRKTWDPYRP
jgi:hypothetical protein